MYTQEALKIAHNAQIYYFYKIHPAFKIVKMVFMEILHKEFADNAMKIAQLALIMAPITAILAQIIHII